MNLINNKSEGSNRLLILLLEGTTTIEAFPLLTDLFISRTDEAFHKLSISRETPVVTLCSKQQLLQSHLTVLEHIRLVLALYGCIQEAHINQWLEQTNLAEQCNTRIGDLTETQRRSFSLLLSLLPGPDFLFVDDLAGGLSMPASQEVWQLLQKPFVSKGRVIIYATQDLQATHVLGADEVWFLESGQVKYKWPGKDLPPYLSTGSAFVLEFDRQKNAAHFQETIHGYAKQFGVLHSWQPARASTPTVVVFLDTTERLVDLMLAAGSSLVNFRSHPVRLEDLPERWNQANAPVVTQSRQPEAKAHKLALFEGEWPGYKRRQAWVQIGLSEWRRHFRGFWCWGNVLLSNLLPLGLLSSLAQGMKIMSTDDFLLLAAIMLLASAGLVVGWGVEAMNRLVFTDDLKGGKSIGAADRRQTLPPLSLFDISPTGRHGLLVGLLIGQGFILLTHAAPLLLLWVVAFFDFTFLAISLLFWLLIAQVGMALAILLGRLARTAGQSHVLGWLAYLGVLFTAVSLKWAPETWQISAWFWPFAGYTITFRNLLTPGSSLARVAIPFMAASVSSVVLWWAGIRSFCRRPSIWRATR